MALADFFDKLGSGLSAVPAQGWFSLAQGLAGSPNFAQGLAGGLQGMQGAMQQDKRRKAFQDALGGMAGSLNPQQQAFINALEPEQAMPILGEQLFRQPQQGPFQSKAVDAEAMNIILQGKSDTPEYAMAHWQLTQPKMSLTPQGLIPVTPTLPAWVKPPSAQAQAAMPPQGHPSQAMPQTQATPQQARVAVPAPAPTAPLPPSSVTAGAPIPGTAPVTEEMRKNAGFAKRLESAIDLIDEHGDAFLSDWNATVKDVPWGWHNKFVTNEFQQADQAARDFVNAMLRRESGAVISPSEFENAYRQYLPQWGDKPDVLEQKRQAREIALANMNESSGALGKPLRQRKPRTPGNIPRVNTQAEFDALPSGAEYTEPDGKRYRKP